MKKTSTRGRTFTGTVISDKMTKTVTVEWSRKCYIPKYERYEVRRSRVKAHLPDEFEVVIGDKVKVKETRPLSKTKHFIVIEKVIPEEKPAKESKKPLKKAAGKSSKKTSKSSGKSEKKAVEKTPKSEKQEKGDASE